ncbi:hypothetical protein BJV78DRAFT_1239734 [Lactifluus subvellereus]|nr:hypothetical protein BJV78DRAFT_1239734 [Lactifluus subvellereus]
MLYRSYGVQRYKRTEHNRGIIFLISGYLSPAEMFNNSYEQLPTMSTPIQANGRDPSIPGAGPGCANSANNPSFPRPGFQLDPVRHDCPQPGIQYHNRNPSSLAQGTITHPIPAFSRQTDHWYRGGPPPEHGRHNAAATSWESGDHAPVSYDRSMVPNIPSGQPEGGEVSYPPTNNPLSGGGYATYPLHLPSTGVYATPNAQGGPDPAWQFLRCWIEEDGGDQIRVILLCRRFA